MPLAALFDGNRIVNGHAGPDPFGRALLADPQTFDVIPPSQSRIATVRLIETIGNGQPRHRPSDRRRRRLH